MIKSELLANLQPSTKADLETHQPSTEQPSVTTHMTARPSTRKHVLSNDGEPALSSLTAAKLQQILQDKASLLAGLSAGIQNKDAARASQLRSDAQAMLAIANQLRTKPGANTTTTQATVDAISRAQALLDSLATKYAINRDAPLATEKDVASDAQALWTRLATSDDTASLVAQGGSTVEQWKKYGETKEGSELMESISKAVIGSAADWVDVAANFAKQSLTFAHMTPDEMLAQSKLLVYDPEFRQEFIDEVKDTAIKFLHLYLPLMDIPHVKGHVQSVDFELDNFDAGGLRINPDTVAINLHDKGVTIDAKGIHGEMNDITWKFERTSFPKASGEGKVDSTIKDAEFHIALEVLKEDGKTWMARMEKEEKKAKELKEKQERKQKAKRDGGGRRGGASMDKERKTPMPPSSEAPPHRTAVEHPATFPLPNSHQAKKIRKHQELPYHLSLVLKEAKVKINDMQVKVTEADHVGWIYNLFLSLFSGTVRDQVEKELNAEVEEQSHELLAQLNKLTEDMLPALFKFNEQHQDVVEAAKIATAKIPLPATSAVSGAPLVERRASGSGAGAVPSAAPTAASTAAAAIASASALPSAPRRGSLSSVGDLEAKLQVETKRADEAVRQQQVLERELKEVKHNMERAMHQVNELERERTQHVAQLEQRLKLAEQRAARADGTAPVAAIAKPDDKSGIAAASASNGAGSSMSP